MENLINLRSNKGSAFIFTAATMFLGVLLVIIMVDIGNAYANKLKLQQISDAAALSGAANGTHAYIKAGSGEKRAVIKQDEATSKAHEIININLNNYGNDTLKLESVLYNPPQYDPDGRLPEAQYYSGDFTVMLNGTSETLLGKIYNGFFELNVKSKVRAYPK